MKNDRTTHAPIDFQREAHRWISSFEEDPLARSHFELNLNGIRIPLISALRNLLNQRNAIALIELGKGHPHHSHSSSNPFISRLQFIFAWERRPKRKPQAHRAITFVPKTRSHLQEQIIVANQLRSEFQENVVFVLPDISVQSQLQHTHFTICTPFSFIAKWRWPILLWKTSNAIRKMRRYFDSRSDSDDQKNRALITSTLTVFENSLFYFLALVEGLFEYARLAKPSLWVAGNPYTLEGKATGFVAKSSKTPYASIEHGSILANDPIWTKSLFDLICVWGESSQSALLKSGIPPEKIVITGSPLMDEIENRKISACLKSEKRYCLVATSGPGDLVSLEQHLRFIEALHKAAVQSPTIHWVVKLHPKDKESFYGPDRPSNIKLVRGSGGRLEIYDFLESAHSLVTISSTAAIDAMNFDIPVINFFEKSSQKSDGQLEFLQAQCTYPVSTSDELARAVRAAALPEDKTFISTRQRAKEYIQRHFKRTTTATSEVAKNFVHLKTRETSRTGYV